MSKKRFTLTWAGWLGAAIILFWLIVAIVGPFVAPFTLGEFVADQGFAPAGGKSLLGADYLGRDLFSRIVHGASLTLAMAGAATLIATSVGSALGIFAAIKGGWTDMIISRIVDTFHSFPTLMLGLVVIAALGPSAALLIVMTGLIYATSVYRIARALGMDIVVMDYVQVARARGEPTSWVLFHEILPNAATPLVVDFGIRLSFSILFLSSLSFLGLGIQPPYADWGSLVRENMPGLISGSVAAIYPALAIASLTIGLNLIVDDFAASSGRSIASRIA
ncbi:MAG: ABC transporter permease [Rhodobacteraceae bacterium]|nr:ABC transporter permease [Paracoccaceae bacterium]